MIIKSKKSEFEALLETAKIMALAAKTAPKSLGLDLIDTLIITKSDLNPIIKEMKKIGKNYNKKYFIRDANNISSCDILLLIGTKYYFRNLEPCNFCQTNNCKNKKNNFCVFNSIDLGIAIGSACNIASNNKVDYRVFFTAAKAAMNLKKYLSECKLIISIPIAAKSKNIFYDRNDIK